MRTAIHYALHGRLSSWNTIGKGAPVIRKIANLYTAACSNPENLGLVVGNYMTFQIVKGPTMFRRDQS